MAAKKFLNQDFSAQKIVAAVKELVTYKAFNCISLEEIAFELGCQIEDITVHFDSLDGLLFQVIENDYNDLRKLVQTAQSKDGNHVDKLYQILVAYMEFGVNLNKRYDGLFTFYTSDDKHSITELAQKIYYQFEYAVLQLKDQQTEETLIYSAFLSMHGFIHHHKGYVTDFEEIRPYAEAHAWFILKGLA